MTTAAVGGSPVRGQPPDSPETLTSADATRTLADLYVPDDVDVATGRAIAFLLSGVQEDGAMTTGSYRVALTALSVMALASVGHTPTDPGPAGRAMTEAIRFVLLDGHRTAAGYFGVADGSRMYGHGIVTLMLTEMAGMTGDEALERRLHEALQQSLALILRSQDVRKEPKLQGGWRYQPDATDSDLSVSVWCVMALRSANNDGVDVPRTAIDQAVAYLRRSYIPIDDADPAGVFTYRPGRNERAFPMTSAGLLAMQVCGQYDAPEVSAAARWLLRNPPAVGDRFFFYGIYYYAQGMHQVGGEAATAGRRVTADLLLPLQRRDGSFGVGRGEEHSFGKVYSTALSVLALSVRYHYLPIYQR